MKGNILLVDDEPGALKLLKEILAAEGHQVRPFTSGELALRSILAERPELILLDIRMPGLDGFAVCRSIKENAVLKDIPVIFISAAADIEDKVRAFQTGGVDYITKPFQKEEVLARVTTHLSLTRSLEALKRVEEDLSKSEESLRLAQGLAHLGHWEWDIATGQFALSNELCLLIGLQVKDHTGDFDAFLGTIHPDDRERVVDLLTRSREAGFETEFRVLLANGAERVVYGKGELITVGGRRRIMGLIQEIPEQKKMLGVVQDITERKELERQLEQQANTDSLTGCARRRHFLELGAREFARHQRYGGEMSLLMLDVDRFKAINDAYGHHLGDTALITLVRVCNELLRKLDVLGRLGGEEFAILLPETASAAAREVAERVRAAVASAEVAVGQQRPPLHFTTSVGVATLARTDGSVDELIARADKALYEAKRLGRNRVCFA